MISEKDLTGKIDRICASKSILGTIERSIALGVCDYGAIKKGHEKHMEDDDGFRATYRHFYQLRFTDGINVDAMFSLIESNKTCSIGKAIEKLVVDRNRPECNFVYATKALHTIDNDLPIYDSKVEMFFDLGYNHGNSYDQRVSLAERVYADLQKLYKNKNKNGLSRLAKVFEKMFPRTGFSDVKKIDFMIWGFGRIEKSDKKTCSCCRRPSVKKTSAKNTKTKKD